MVDQLTAQLLVYETWQWRENSECEVNTTIRFLGETTPSECAPSGNEENYNNVDIEESITKTTIK